MVKTVLPLQGAWVQFLIGELKSPLHAEQPKKPHLIVVIVFNHYYLGIFVTQLLGSVWAPVTNDQRLGGLNNKYLFLIALEAGKSRIKMPTGSESDEGSLPGLWTPVFLLCPHMAETDRELSEISFIKAPTPFIRLPWWLSGKESTWKAEDSGRKWQSTPVSLLGKSHGQRRLVGYSQWGHKRVKHGWATKQQCHSWGIPHDLVTPKALPPSSITFEIRFHHMNFEEGDTNIQCVAIATVNWYAMGSSFLLLVRQ